MAAEPTGQDDGWDPDQDVETPPVPWTTRAQVLAAVLWPSFLAACFATMLFFAYVDPGLLHEGSTAELRTTRMTAYGVGFFFFWLVAAVSSALSVYLIRTSHIRDQDKDDPQ